MVRKSRKTQRRHRRHRRQQRGGGWGFNGPAFAPAGGMAPLEARAVTDDCAVLDRPAPSVTPTGAWSQGGGGCSSCAVLAPPIAQSGGGFLNFLGLGDASANAMDMPEPIEEVSPASTNADGGSAVLVGGSRYRKSRKGRKQRGGGGGGGGYGFQLNNDLGKVYAALPVGPCPSGQRGGGDASVVSYPAGYGYSTASAIEEGNGSAHFLAQIPYGKHCMGGGARKATGGHGGRRKSHSRHRKGSRKSQRKGHRKSHKRSSH
jgi:hypothetical protein